MRTLIAPGKVDGSPTAAEVAAYIATGLQHTAPGSETDRYPIADGGDGIWPLPPSPSGSPPRSRRRVSGPTGEPITAATHARRHDRGDRTRHGGRAPLPARSAIRNRAASRPRERRPDLRRVGLGEGLHRPSAARPRAGQPRRQPQYSTIRMCTLVLRNLGLRSCGVRHSICASSIGLTIVRRPTALRSPRSVAHGIAARPLRSARPALGQV
ncbi:glycerate kinase [Pseudonocardia sp. C8]|uniref:glycerate kinase n=1 Tax=Pseudonocardia sp. C8 TaxID=2762759 RepID=UPI0016430AF3|nr:glycerate kinase [Pseudonocardia sp. C8]